MQELEIDLTDPEVRRDPYPQWARLRDLDRVVRSRSLSPSGFGPAVYVVHRYEDVRRVLADHDSYSSARLMGGSSGGEGGGEGPSGRQRFMQALMNDPGIQAMLQDPDVQENLRGGFFGGATMLTADRPEHDRLRGVVNKAFLPRQVSSLEGSIRELTQDLVRPLAAGGRHDLIDVLAGPLPSIVIAELLGIPREDHAQFAAWSNAVVGAVAPPDSASLDDPLARVRAFLFNPERMALIAEFRRYLAEQIDRYRVEQGDNLISRMVAANENDQLTAEELMASTFLLLIAGNETTTRLVANLAVALHRHPDQRDLLAEDPSLVPGAIEEGLRYDSPVQVISRVSTSETDIGGAVIPEGRVVTVAIAAANRDPLQFKDPDRFDVRRSEGMSVSFGYGIHYCLGAPLARREARIAFEELLKVAPAFTVVDADDLEYRPMLGAALRGPEHVLIET